MRILDRVDISGSMSLASAAKDAFTIGSQLENSDVNADNLLVYANADFKNNVTLGSSSLDSIVVNGMLTASSGLTISNNSSLYISGSGTLYYNGMDVFASMTGGGGGGGNSGDGGGGNENNKTNPIEQILPGNDILVSTSGTTVTLSFDSASLDGYAFLLNSSSFTPQIIQKTVYFSFDPHYNNVTYFNANSQYENLKSATYAVSDRSMSVTLPPVQTHLGKTFTFVNATYVGTASNDTVGYSSSAGGLFTTTGKYSVHKITFYPYTSGNYTDYIGAGKITGYNDFSTYLITNAVTDYRLLVGQENETDQHNFITLQAVSSSQFGYTWMIRDVNDYVPFAVGAL